MWNVIQSLLYAGIVPFPHTTSVPFSLPSELPFLELAAFSIFQLSLRRVEGKKFARLFTNIGC